MVLYRVRGEGARTRLIGRDRGYHGVGFGGISVGGIVANRKTFGPLLPGEQQITRDLCVYGCVRVCMYACMYFWQSHVYMYPSAFRSLLCLDRFVYRCLYVCTYVSLHGCMYVRMQQVWIIFVLPIIANTRLFQRASRSGGRIQQMLVRLLLFFLFNKLK